MAEQHATTKWIVLYDGECGFCKCLLYGLLRFDTHARIRSLALQDRRADELLSELSPDARMASWHVIEPGGRRYSAGAALPPVLRLLRFGGPPAYVLGLMPALTERAYAWIADHRVQLSQLLPSDLKRSTAAALRAREQRLPLC